MRVLHILNGILPVYVTPAYCARCVEKVPNLRCEKEDQPATPFAV